MNEHERKLLNAQRNRIEESDMLDDAQRELLTEFDTQLGRDTNIGGYTHESHLRRIRYIAEHRDPHFDHTDAETTHGVTLADALEDEDEALALLDWINNKRNINTGEPLSKKGRTHFRTAVRVFGRLMTDGDDVPPAIDVIPGGEERDRSEKDPTPAPSSILHWYPDTVTVLEATQYSRDRALAALAWDSGARSFELRDLTYGDVAFEGDFIRVTVGGKDHPERDPLCVAATPYVRYYLEKDHPANEDGGFQPDTPLWTRLDENVKLSTSTFTSLMSVNVGPHLPDDFGKPINLQHFRKSRASVVAMGPNMNRTKLENRFGWDHDSPAPAHYIARFKKKTDEDIAMGDGLSGEHLDLDDPEEVPDPAPVNCPTCERWTPSHRTTCLWCEAEFDPDGLEQATPDVVLQEDAKQRELRDEFMADVAQDNVDPDELEVAVRFGDFLANNEEAADAAAQLRDALDDDD